MMGQDASCLCNRLCFHVPYFRGLSESLKRDLYYQGICPLFCYVWDLGCLPWHNLFFRELYTRCASSGLAKLQISKRPHYQSFPHPNFTFPCVYLSHRTEPFTKDPFNSIRVPEGAHLLPRAATAALGFFLWCLCYTTVSTGYCYLLLQQRH